jgi:hypothetical protein
LSNLRRNTRVIGEMKNIKKIGKDLESLVLLMGLSIKVKLRMSSIMVKEG